MYIVKGYLNLKNYESGDLTNLTIVKNSLDLSKYKYGNLINLKKVGIYLDLSNYESGDLTNLTTVEGNLFLNLFRYIKGDLTRFKDKIKVVIDMEKYTKKFYLEYLILNILNKIDFNKINILNIIKFEDIENFFKENNK